MEKLIPDGFTEVVMENPFIDLFGPIYSRFVDKKVEVGIYTQDRHNNPGGIVHGGLLMSLVDNLMGATIYSVVGPRPMATVSLNCDFLAATRPGEWLCGSAEVTRHTRSMVFIRGMLTADDKPVMSAAGIFKLMDPPTA